MSARCEAIVIGLGAMGSAACAQLARRGIPVLGLDRFDPPHPYGSTHGDTRMTRVAVGEGPEYVPLVQRSHVLWRELEAETGTRLLTHTGGLILAHPDSPFFAQTQAVARRFGVAHERLSNAELRERFDMFSVDEVTEGYYEPESGYVRVEAAVAAQLEVARRHGADLRPGETVLSWTASERGVAVTTDAGRHDAARLIVCAGAWLSQLLPEMASSVAVYRQLLYWFEIRTGHERLQDMPVFIWDFGGEREGVVHLDGFYGFPAVDGPAGGVKIGTESYAETSVPDGRQHPAAPAEIAAMHARYVADRLPWVGPAALRTASCLYTSAPHCRFLIDRHPEHEAVLIVSACSGHGFKHSPAIGEAVAAWVTGEPTAPGVDLGPFRSPPRPGN